MGEAARKAGPAVQLGEQVGDADARHEHVEPSAQRACKVALLAADGRNFQPGLMSEASTGLLAEAASTALSFLYNTALRASIQAAAVSGSVRPSRPSARRTAKVAGGSR